MGINDIFSVSVLICGTNDKGYIESFVQDKRKRNEVGISLFTIAREIGNPDEIKKWIDEFELSGNDILELVKTINNPEYTKNIIEEKREKLGLTSDDVLNLVYVIDEPEYIKSIIEDKEKIKELGLRTNNIKELIETLDEPEYINDFLEERFSDFSEEQIYRVENYLNVKSFLCANYHNNVLKNSIKYLMANDENWIISLDKLIKNELQYYELSNNLFDIDEDKITVDFMLQALSVMSQEENYFDIKSYDDVNNFYDITVKKL